MIEDWLEWFCLIGGESKNTIIYTINPDVAMLDLSRVLCYKNILGFLGVGSLLGASTGEQNQISKVFFFVNILEYSEVLRQYSGGVGIQNVTIP